MGLASRWPCVTDDRGLPSSTAYEREMSTPPALLLEYGPPLPLPLLLREHHGSDSCCLNSCRSAAVYMCSNNVDFVVFWSFLYHVTSYVGLVGPVKFTNKLADLMFYLTDFFRCKTFLFDFISRFYK